MQLNEQKFLIERICSVEETKKNRKKYVDVILRRVAPKDELGDPIGEDDLFRVTVWEKDFHKMNGINKGDRVLAQLYVNGREQLDSNSKIYYSVSFTLKSIKHFENSSK